MKSEILLVIATMMLAGCATVVPTGMWCSDRSKDFKWVGETRLEGDVPRTAVGTKSGEWMIFQ